VLADRIAVWEKKKVCSERRSAELVGAREACFLARSSCSIIAGIFPYLAIFTRLEGKVVKRRGFSLSFRPVLGVRFLFFFQPIVPLDIFGERQGLLGYGGKEFLIVLCLLHSLYENFRHFFSAEHIESPSENPALLEIVLRYEELFMTRA
jgi:hypothetical protein